MHTNFILEHGDTLGQLLSESWDTWRGDCQCGKTNAVGFCDRCVECAVTSIYENEREFGGTTEAVIDYFREEFGVEDVSKTHPRLTDHVAERALAHQVFCWEYHAQNYKETF